MRYKRLRHPCLPLAASLLSVTLSALPGQPKKHTAGPGEFDRAQLMVMNLNRGKGSSGYYLQESQRLSRQMLADLDKAAAQLEQVDKFYARSRGRPDDRFLLPAGKQIAEARAAARKLEEALSGARAELREGINQLLLSE